MKLFSSLVLLLLFAPSSALAGNEPAVTAVDSGSFGVFVGAKRTATEKFSVEQTADGYEARVYLDI